MWPERGQGDGAGPDRRSPSSKILRGPIAGARFVDDLELALDLRLSREETYDPPDLRLRRRRAQTEHDQAGVVGGWIAPRVGEAEIESDETASLGLGRGSHVLVGMTGKSLVVGRGDVVTPSGEGFSGVTVDVLVELDVHEPLTRGTMRSVASRAP